MHTLHWMGGGGGWLPSEDISHIFNYFSFLPYIKAALELHARSVHRIHIHTYLH